MLLISNQSFGGERALYKLSDARLEGVTILAGESPLKHGTNLFLKNCRIEGKYPLWINTDTTLEECLLTESARSGPWYLKRFKAIGTRFECPKAFRDSKGLEIAGCVFTKALETLWSCSDVEIRGTEFDNADYLLIHSNGVRIRNATVNGNYLGQWGRDFVVENSVLNSRDAFWNSENVTCRNCVIDGEYLGWHSKKLRLIDCKIKGRQPLCYCENLVLENCEMDSDAVLAFEYCSVRADIRGSVTNVKNPTTGAITADSIGEVIIDENVLPPADCRIKERRGK